MLQIFFHVSIDQGSLEISRKNVKFGGIERTFCQKIQKNLGIRLTPGLLDMSTSFQHGGGLLSWGTHQWSENYTLFSSLEQRNFTETTGIKKMTFFLSLNRNTARNYRNEAKYLGIFSCQKQLQRKGFGGNMERRRKQHKKKKQQHRKQRGRIDIILKVSTSATQDEFCWEKQRTGVIQYSDISREIGIWGKVRSYSMLLSPFYGQIVSFEVHMTGTFILFFAGLVCVIEGLRPGNFSVRNYLHLSRWKHASFSLKWDYL